MINESNTVCLKFYSNQFMFINLVLYKRSFIYLFKTASVMFLSYILFELLDVENGSPIKCKNVNCNSLGLALGIDRPPPGGILYTMIYRYYIL